MNVSSLFIFQIIADVALCVAILFLLRRIGGNIVKTNASGALDPQYLREFRELIQESRAEAGRFSRTMEDNYQKFKELALQLEEKEANLSALIREVQRQCERSETLSSARDQAGKTNYDAIITLFKAGVSVKEVAQRSGLTEGEVSLIFDLENKRQSTAPR